VNNAAVTYLEPVGELSEKRWRLMFEVQVRAPFELAELVLPGMRERARGWILNISSRSATHPVGPPFEELHTKGGWAAYGMCKAALNRFTTALAAETYGDGVAVNALAPWDNVATPGAGTHELVDGFALEGPDWVAEAALALCSGPPELTGRIAYSQPLLAELGLRPVSA
jgi:NAD(P)-dependent dehydrogenase (short-subunit alcohol dehydrogenase family)